MKKFTLPKMSEKTECTIRYIFNQKTYFFKYIWCDYICLLDIYISQENGNKYLIKGFPIVTGIDLVSRVKNPQLITGKIFIQNKYDKDLQPDINNFNTDFELVYYEKDEVLE